MFDIFRDPMRADHKRIVFVTTADHRYTFARARGWLKERKVLGSRIGVEALLAADTLPHATYILTDFDRMSPTEVEVLGKLRDRLLAAGLTVLNDPRGFRPRAAVVRLLHSAGINDFTCWLPAFGERPDRFPVFLRSLAAHRSVIGDLLHDADAAQAALEAARAEGFAVADLGFFEYAAERDAETGAFQKNAAFFIDGVVIRANSVNDTSWIAKHGSRETGTARAYAAELAEMDCYPHEALIKKVFELAEVEYGRCDFGLVHGKPQIYEINTNPGLVFNDTHDFSDRTKTMQLVKNRIADRLAEIAMPPPFPAAEIDVSDLWERRKRRPLTPRRP